MQQTPKTQKDRRTSALELFNIALGLILCGLVILLRVCEVNNLFYRIVIAIQFIWLILNTFLLLARAAEAIGKAYRRFKTDRRIMRQAKAAGIWENPQMLGGRALELYAKKKHGIKRKPGQTDRNLRCYCLIKENRAIDYSIEVACLKYTGEKDKDLNIINQWIAEAIEAESKK